MGYPLCATSGSRGSGTSIARRHFGFRHGLPNYQPPVRLATGLNARYWLPSAASEKASSIVESKRLTDGCCWPKVSLHERPLFSLYLTKLLLPYRATRPLRAVDAACAVRFRSAHCCSPTGTVTFQRRSVSLRRGTSGNRSGTLPRARVCLSKLWARFRIDCLLRNSLSWLVRQQDSRHALRIQRNLKLRDLVRAQRLHFTAECRNFRIERGQSFA